MNESESSDSDSASIYKMRGKLKNKENTFLCELEILDKWLEDNSKYRDPAINLEKMLLRKGKVLSQTLNYYYFS